MPEQSPTKLSRRRLIGGGLAAGVLLSLGGWITWVSTGYELPDSVRRSLRSLSVKEFLVVAAVAKRMVRGSGATASREAGFELAAFIDGLAYRMDVGTRRDLSRLLYGAEQLFPLWAGHLGRFTRLSGDQQDRVLECMQTSERALLRGAFDSLKSLAVLAHYRRVETWREIGYDGPTVGRPAAGWG